MLMIAAAGFVGAALARLVAFDAAHSLLVWPLTGVALATGWRFGLRWTLPAGVGAGAWAFLQHGQPEVAVATLLCTSVGATLAVALINRWARTSPARHRLEAALRFVFVVTIVAAPLDALIATAALVDTGGAGDLLPAEVFVSCWLFDASSMILFAPALLALASRGVVERDHDAVAEPSLDLPALLMSLSVAAAIVSLAALGHPQYGRHLIFLYFPIAVLIGVRMPERANAVSLFASALPLLAVQPFVWRGALPHTASIEVSLVLLSAACLGLLLQAVVADRRHALSRLADQADRDLATGLLNDRGLHNALGERLAWGGRPNYGLLGLQIANFDTLRDLCGPLQAVRLEQSVAMLLQRQPGGQLAARLSSGRFAILLACETVHDLRTLARTICAQLNGQIYDAEHASVRLQASVGGLLLEGSTSIDAEGCLLSLSEAMSIASGVPDPQVFVEQVSQSTIDVRRARQSRTEHVRHAIREQRLEIFAEPMADPLAPAGTLAYEVLTRLRDRNGSLLLPQDFLPLAVQSRMTIALDRGVIQKVFAWLADNPEALARTHRCSINLSGPTMSDGSTAGFVREQHRRFNIPASKIVFEITESEAIRNPDAASRLFDELKSEGFSVALDDFGTGLSSFEYLKRFPVDYLKIDGTFVRDLLTNPVDDEIVKSTVRVARMLGVRSIAEYVRNRATLERLSSLGVEVMQGELIGSPVPIARLFEQRRASETAVALAQAWTYASRANPFAHRPEAESAPGASAGLGG